MVPDVFVAPQAKSKRCWECIDRLGPASKGRNVDDIPVTDGGNSHLWCRSQAIVEDKLHQLEMNQGIMMNDIIEGTSSRTKARRDRNGLLQYNGHRFFNGGIFLTYCHYCGTDVEAARTMICSGVAWQHGAYTGYSVKKLKSQALVYQEMAERLLKLADEQQAAEKAAEPR